MSDHIAFNPAQYLTKISGAEYLEVKWRLLWLRHDHPDAIIRTEMVADKLYNITRQDGSTVSVQEAIFKATIILPSLNGAEGSGYGSETSGDFKDYREKAETKAIGRACGSLGYGTQFAPDHDFGANQGRVVDSPVRVGGGTNDPAPQTTAGAGIRPAQPGGVRASAPVSTARYTAPQGNVAPSPQGSTHSGGQDGRSTFQQGQRPSGGNVAQVQAQAGVIGDPSRPASEKQIKYVTDLLSQHGYDPNAFEWDGLTNGEASGYITMLRSGQIPQDIIDALAEAGVEPSAANLGNSG